MRSDVEAFTTAAFACDVWILETEGLIQAIFDEIDLGAVNELQCVGVDHDLHAPVLENDVIGAEFLGVIDNVGVAGAAGLGNTQPEPYACATRIQIFVDAASRRLCE